MLGSDCLGDLALSLGDTPDVDQAVGLRCGSEKTKDKKKKTLSEQTKPPLILVCLR